MKTLYKITLFIALLAFAANVFAQTSERERGIELYKKGDYAAAAAALEKVSRQADAKNDGDVWNYLGLAYAGEREFKKAGKALENAVKLKPENAEFRTNLALAYLMTRKIDKAQSEISKALVLDPKNINTYYLRGTARLWEGRASDAIADADMIIGIDKNSAAGYILKSDAFVALFGKSVKESEEKGNIEYLKKAVEPLEYCLKSCQDSQKSKTLNEKLETVTAFYNYFNPDKKADEKPDFAAPVEKKPLKILTRPQPKYTESARNSGAEGTIKLYVLFAASGIVSHIIVLEKLGYGLDEAAVYAASQIQFEPATENGKPVSVVKKVTYSFDIY